MPSWIEETVPEVHGLNIDELRVDQAFLKLKNLLNTKAWLYALNKDCYKCPFKRINFIANNPTNDTVIKINTARPETWQIFTQDKGPYSFPNETAICELQSPDVGQFGVYSLELKSDSCKLTTIQEPVSIYLPMVFIVLILIACVAVLKISKYCYQKYKNSGPATDFRVTRTHSDDEANKHGASVKKRLRSLDTFRGISIVLMIFVNSGGGHYWWIEHAPWNGLHVADFVFPWFMWIMGVCIPMSFKSQVARGIPKSEMLKNVARRGLTLFLIGFCMNTNNTLPLKDVRIFGVLQRFGVAYFFIASCHILLMRGYDSLPSQNRVFRALHDVWLLLPQWIVMLVLTAVYLIVTFAMDVPGCGKGYLGPGGTHEMLAHKDCIGGANGYLDRKILGVMHIYQNPTAKEIYDSGAFDPEGIFGCLLSIVHVFFGVQCGMILVVYSDWWERIKRWLAWGIGTGLIGGLLCLFSKEDGWIPINKNMWSLSFVLVTTCSSFVLLLVCYFIIDVKRLWAGTPFLYAGMNAIIMFVGHSIFHRMLPWHWRIGSMNTHFVLLLYSTWGTVVWVLVAFYLYKRKIFYTI